MSRKPAFKSAATAVLLAVGLLSAPQASQADPVACTGIVTTTKVIDGIDYTVESIPTNGGTYGAPATCTWTVPAGITSINPVLIGAGGGGGGGNGVHRVSLPARQGGGGGGAGVIEDFGNRTVVPGSTIDVTVGFGGTRGYGGADLASPAGDATDGEDGDDTSLMIGATNLTARGGQRGFADGTGGGNRGLAGSNPIGLLGGSGRSNKAAGVDGSQVNNMSDAINISGTAIAYGNGGAGASSTAWGEATSTTFGSGGQGGRGSLSNTGVYTYGYNADPGVDGRAFIIYESNKVYFNEHDGTSVSDAPYTTGGSISAPTAPTRTGLSFDGWYANATGGAPVSFPYSPSGAGAKYLHAQWSGSVSYNNDNATTPEDGTQTSYKIGSGISLPETDPIRTGAEFLGWFVAPTGGTALSGTYTPPGPTYGPVTLYAHWHILALTVTYDYNGANGAIGQSSDSYINGDPGLSLPTPRKTGYRLQGWNCGEVDSPTTLVAVSTAYVPTTNVTCTASWTAISQPTPLTNHVVTFKPNGGTGAVYTETSQLPTSLRPNWFNRVGYVFTGWNTLANGKGVAYADLSNYAFDANLTLYAQWRVVKSKKLITTFAADKPNLKATMKWTIKTWIKKLPKKASIVCQGSTSGKKITAFDKKLAASRAKNVCRYAKVIRPDIKYTISLNPSSATKIAARHVWMFQQ